MVTWAFIFTHGDFTLKQKARRWGQLEVMTSPGLLSARQGERLVNTPDRATLVWLEPWGRRDSAEKTTSSRWPMDFSVDIFLISD